MAFGDTSNQVLFDGLHGVHGKKQVLVGSGFWDIGVR